MLRGVLLSDLAATVLAMPVSAFPALAVERFGTPAATGWFLSALAAGGIAAGVLSGRVTRSGDLGRRVVLGGCGWGVALTGFGLSDGVLSIGFLVLAGAADTVSVIARGALVQQFTPEEFLGRVSALENVVGVAGPGCGNLRTGAVAELTSPGASVALGGVCAVAAIAALWWRSPRCRTHRCHHVE
ncbi:MFS transporter [Kineococcus sp. SYSU DK003]|uniref:MFS transporter n=1 Tax=Kineococcus sp. SYSU DK003 TaxID=3383124 RepID=UPI003D7D7104